MDEVTELDNKYIVIKRNDINLLSEYDRDHLLFLCEKIEHIKHPAGKSFRVQPPNKYVVLNQEDKINLPYLLENIPEDDLGNIQVKDLSVVLVNAILEAAGTTQ